MYMYQSAPGNIDLYFVSPETFLLHSIYFLFTTELFPAAAGAPRESVCSPFINFNSILGAVCSQMNEHL